VTISLIWAQARDRVIGTNGAIPWHLPEDLANFKSLTMGATVVMGRATWDSLPERFRPLPGRHNVVLTRQSGWSAPDVVVASSLDQALAGSADIWVIGGAAVYAEALPRADRVVLTQVDASYDGDTFAPELDGSWQLVDVDPHDGWKVSSSGLNYRINTYEKAA
jgi:dihydrofolate reductase